MKNRKLIEALRDYCQATLDGEFDCDGGDFPIGSALINMIDTPGHGIDYLTVTATQDEREAALMDFILMHRNPPA